GPRGVRAGPVRQGGRDLRHPGDGRRRRRGGRWRVHRGRRRRRRGGRWCVMRIFDWLSLVFVAAIVYVLVRPRSKAAELVDGVGNMLVSLVRQATDLAST